MFHCKWVTSGGLLERAWIEGKFNGSPPEYIHFNRNHNVPRACNNLMEVVKSDSRNLNHRISLRSSADLSYGVCCMHRKKVEQILKDCVFKYKHTSDTNISASDTTESSDSGSLKRLFIDTTVSENTSRSDNVNVLNSSGSEMDPGTMRGSVTSREYGDTSVPAGLPSNSENEITVISYPDVKLSMLPCDSESNWQGANTMEMDTSSTCQVPSTKENLPDIFIDDPNQRFSENFQELDDTGEHLNSEQANVCDVNKLPTASQEKNDFDKSKWNSGESPSGSESSIVLSSVDEEYKHPLNVSKGSLTNLQTLKIQDTYENFMSQSHLDHAAECFDFSNQRKRRFCVRDNRTTLSDQYMRRNILNLQCHLRSKDNFPEAACGMEASNGDGGEDGGSGMLNVTISRRKIIDVGDVTPINIISPDARPIDAVQTPSIEDTSFTTIRPEDILTSSNESVLRIELPSPPTTNHHSEEETHNVPTSSIQMEHDSMSSEADVENTSHSGVVNIILPMYLRHRVDPTEIKVVVGSMRNCDDLQIQMHSDMEDKSSSSKCSSLFSSRNTSLPQSDKLRREWGEDGVYRKLATLWRHIRKVSPEKLINQGSQCGNIHMAKARMFHSILCLKAKGIVRCIKFNGETKYIVKGSVMMKHSTNLTD